jgi:hypothetical protein
MKCLKLLLILLFLFTYTSFAQEDTDQDSETEEEVCVEENAFIDYKTRNPFHFLEYLDIDLGLYAATMPFINQQAFGGGLDFQIGYTNNCSVGLSVAMMGRKVDPKFGYNIGESKLHYVELNLYNEIKVFQWKKLQTAIRLNTGYAAFKLSDNSIKEKYLWYDEYGNAYEGERALTIETNKFFKVAPVLYLRYHVAYHVGIEASAGYNFYIGDAQYGRNADFNNYMLQLGVKFDLN